MDEPTNHLDMRSKDLLKEALLNYGGALVVVSHDRDFLQGLTTKVFEFRNKNIKPYFGDVYDYLNTRKIETLQELEKPAAAVAVSTEPVARQKKETPASREEKKKRDNQLSKLQKQIADTEEKIAKAEQEIKNIETTLANPTAPDFNEKLNQYAPAQMQLEKLMAEWEHLTGEMEGIG